MKLAQNINNLKSVKIRSSNLNRRLFMSANLVEAFRLFLKRTISNDIIIINTNLGLEIYYSSEKNYSNYIKESVILYTLKYIDSSKLKFENSLNLAEVQQNFNANIQTISQYPQLFLAYVKKFIHTTNNNETSNLVMPLLNDFFKKSLQQLEKNNTFPHLKKIKREQLNLVRFSKKGTPLKNLYSEFLLKIHMN